jgi:hypothetical protein
MIVRIIPDPRKILNRPDHPVRALGTRVAKDPMFQPFSRKTQQPILGAFRSLIRFPPMNHFVLAFLAPWWFNVFLGSGLGDQD